MTDKQRPEELLEFPTQFQFKALGIAGEVFKRDIILAISLHAPVSTEAVYSRPSGKGTYQAVSVLLTIHSYQQLTDIYAEMGKVPGLKMLL